MKKIAALSLIAMSLSMAVKLSVKKHDTIDIEEDH